MPTQSRVLHALVALCRLFFFFFLFFCKFSSSLCFLFISIYSLTLLCVYVGVTDQSGTVWSTFGVLLSLTRPPHPHPHTPALVAHLRCIHMLMSILSECVSFHSASLLIGSKRVAVGHFLLFGVNSWRLTHAHPISHQVLLPLGLHKLINAHECTYRVCLVLTPEPLPSHQPLLFW